MGSGIVDACGGGCVREKMALVKGGAPAAAAFRARDRSTSSFSDKAGVEFAHGPTVVDATDEEWE
jgi:hypothetical protein